MNKTGATIALVKAATNLLLILRQRCSNWHPQHYYTHSVRLFNYV